MGRPYGFSPGDMRGERDIGGSLGALAETGRRTRNRLYQAEPRQKKSRKKSGTGGAGILEVLR